MNTIYIHKGDSTIFADVTKFMTFNIDTELDLTGWQAVFTLGGITKKITDISSKSFEVILTAQDTANLFYGKYSGILKLIDSNGNIKTVSNEIPFNITNEVIENEPNNIDVGVPQSCEVNIEIVIGTPYDKSSVTSVNGQTGDVVLTAQDVGALPDTTVIPDISNLATKEELAEKQDKGDYALVSDIPTLVSELENDSNFATQTQVMQAIASIPQFKLSVVIELPSTGEKMTLYLVPKEGAVQDVYNEYIWIEQTGSFEFIGTTAVDLTDYVQKTDIATADKLGLVRPTGEFGVLVSNAGNLAIGRATKSEIETKTNVYKPIVPATINFAVNSVLPTMTQEQYDALATKDENLFYMIVED